MRCAQRRRQPGAPPGRDRRHGGAQIGLKDAPQVEEPQQRPQISSLALGQRLADSTTNRDPVSNMNALISGLASFSVPMSVPVRKARWARNRLAKRS
jgi:hypothetical protein